MSLLELLIFLFGVGFAVGALSGCETPAAKVPITIMWEQCVKACPEGIERWEADDRYGTYVCSCKVKYQ